MSSERYVRFLLRLYPASFRARYGGEIVAFHRERMREANGSLARVTFDHLTSAFAEHMRVIPTLFQDVRFALRGLIRRPTFAAVVLATIALGVGANAAIFSVVHAVLLRPLPYPHPERVVSFGQQPPQWLLSQPELFSYRDDVHSLESISVYIQGEGNLSTDEDPERVAVASVSPEFFSTLGVLPIRGHSFAPDDHVQGPSTPVIISYALWQRKFHSDSSISGKTLTFGGRTRVIAGVMPPHFDYPSVRTAIWTPLPAFVRDSLGNLNSNADRANHYLFGVARLRAGASLERTLVEATASATRQKHDYADRYAPNETLAPAIALVSDNLVGTTRPYLWALLGAVGFVMLIVCANVANLLLARGEGRRKEIALRTALGASSRRITTQLVTEALVLAVLGGALGLALAWAGTRGLVALAPASLPRLDQIGIDRTVLGFTFGASLLAGLLFGVTPALLASRESPSEMLKAGGKSTHVASSKRMRGALVIAEVALAVVTLTGAGMLLRSLVHLQESDMGFDATSVLTARVSPLQNYPEPRTTQFYAQLLDRIRALPGVTSAGAVSSLPVVDATGLWGLYAEGVDYAQLASSPTAAPQEVTTGYFASMRMPVTRGRDFSEQDRLGAMDAVIVSESMAKLVWANDDPIGKRFRLGASPTMVTVVGVVKDIRAHSFTDKPEPTMYFPHPQTRAATTYFMPRSMNLVIRTSVTPLALANQVRAIVHALDPGIPVSNVRTMEQVIGTSVASRRFSTALILGFAALALVLAGIGIYGVISYGVSERTFEIGVRMALGAERGRVLALVVRDGAMMAAAGAVLGLAGAMVVARAIRSMLFGVPMIDVVTMSIVAVALGIVVLLAVAVPARRALNVSPTEALKG